MISNRMIQNRKMDEFQERLVLGEGVLQRKRK